MVAAAQNITQNSANNKSILKKHTGVGTKDLQLQDQQPPLSVGKKLRFSTGQQQRAREVTNLPPPPPPKVLT